VSNDGYPTPIPKNGSCSDIASSLQPGFVAGMVNSAHRQRFLENDAVISDSISDILQFIDIVFFAD